jgi:hypothetical protein
MAGAPGYRCQKIASRKPFRQIPERFACGRRVIEKPSTLEREGLSSIKGRCGTHVFKLHRLCFETAFI